MRCAICLSVIDSALAALIAVASIASGKASGRPPLWPTSRPAHAEFAPGVRPVVHGLAAHFEFARNVLHPCGHHVSTFSARSFVTGELVLASGNAFLSSLVPGAITVYRGS